MQWLGIYIDEYARISIATDCHSSADTRPLLLSGGIFPGDLWCFPGMSFGSGAAHLGLSGLFMPFFCLHMYGYEETLMMIVPSVHTRVRCFPRSPSFAPL